jgi:hypothetical protein
MFFILVCDAFCIAALICSIVAGFSVCEGEIDERAV